jgi:opacity protein-like surface antigen
MMKMLAFIAAGAIASAAVAQSSSSTQSTTTATGDVGTTGASSSASRNTNWTNDNTKPDTAFAASLGAKDNVGSRDGSDTTANSGKKSKRHKPR